MNLKLLLFIPILLVSACSKYHMIEPDGDHSTTDYFVSTRDDAALAAQLPALRHVPLDDEITEIRIWTGFGPLVVHDMYRVFKKEDGTIDGEYILHFDAPLDDWNKEETEEFYKEIYSYCKSIGKHNETESCKVNYYKEIDWEKIYTGLKNLDIWNIPDESEIPKLQHKDVIATLDGFSMVVELKKKGVYRSFSHRLSPTPIIKKYRFAHQIMDVLLEWIK